MFQNKYLLRFTAFITCLAFVTYFIFISPCNTNVVYASGDVISLPADLDCEVTYDASFINILLNGSNYSVNRNTSVVHESGYQFVYSPREGYVYAVKESFNIYRKTTYYTWKNYSYLPITFEEYVGGAKCDTSYWLDPINLKIYVFSTGKNDSWGQFPGVSRLFENNMIFSIKYNKAQPWIVTTSIIDLVSGTVDVGLSYAYYVDSDNFTDVTTNYSLNSYYEIDTGDLADYATYYSTEYQGYDCSPCYYGRYPFIACGVRTELPDNLVCVYANHEIVGFFESSNDDVITPDYYFQYQYLFYKDDIGFVFVDSSSELESIFFESTTKFILTFKELSNFYIYQNTTGEKEFWSCWVTADTMYGNSFTAGLYNEIVIEPFTLIYTNDRNYGNSIKDWESFPDFLDEINTNDSLLDLVHQIVKTDNPVYESDMSLGERLFKSFTSAITAACSAAVMDFETTYDAFWNGFDIISGGDDPNEVILSFLSSMSLNDTFVKNALISPDYFNYFEYDPTTDTWNSIRQTSIYKLLTMNLDYMEDLSLIGKTIRQENFNWMKTLNGNFSSLYDLTVLQGDNLNDSLDSIVSAINNIDVSSSGGSFDLSGITGRFDSLLDGMSFELQDYDYNPNDNDNSVVDYVSDGLDEIITGNILQPLTFSSGVVAAIGFVNDAITNIWENLGDLQPVVVLGLTFTVVDVVVRREGSEA